MQDEQLEIMKNRPPSQTGLTLKDCRKMEYLSKVRLFEYCGINKYDAKYCALTLKVIDETLRIVNMSFLGFREATSDVRVNGE